MTTNTIRLPLSALVFLFVIFFCVALGGGYLGSHLFSVPLPLQPDSDGTLVPVTQQVTVSPSKLASDIAESHSKSTFLLARTIGSTITPLGMGIALTNDGVIMSVTNTIENNLVGIGDDGVVFPLVLLGQDELSGIHFYKASNRIINPVNLSQGTMRIGSSLLTMYRQGDTAQITAQPVTFSATLVPSESAAPGVQKIAHITSSSSIPAGAALLDENGNLAGVMLDPIKNTGLFVSDIRSSLERLSSNQLSFNPFVPLGFFVQWEPHIDANQTLHIKSVVGSVLKNGPADIAGLQIGDTISAISGNAVSWDTTITDLLKSQPVQLSILRQEEQQQISITP